MLITIGSKNKVKIEALRELAADYPLLKDAEITGIEVPSEVSEQPRSLEEVIQGAKNRARNAFQNCAFSFGVEGGFIAVPHTKTGYLELQACVIFDGAVYHLGLSSAYECPPAIVRMVFDRGMTLNEAMNKAGLTADPKIGSSGGSISILTKGRLVRKEYTKEAIRMALIHIENPELYEK